MIHSFSQIIHDQFVTKMHLSNKDDLSDIVVLSFFTELKTKAIGKMGECAEPFFSRLYGLIFSQASESVL